MELWGPQFMALKMGRTGVITYNLSKWSYTWIFQICKNSATLGRVFWVKFGTTFTQKEDPGMTIFEYINDAPRQNQHD